MGKHCKCVLVDIYKIFVDFIDTDTHLWRFLMSRYFVHSVSAQVYQLQVPSLPLSLTHLLYQLLVEQRYIWVHSRHVDVYLPECVFMNWIRPHVIVLLYKIQIFLSFSLKCLLSAINISRQVPLEKWRVWTVRECNVKPSPQFVHSH